MLNTLLISYTPRFDSNTAKLAESFLQYNLEHSAETSNITHLDLVKTPPPLLLEGNLNAILKRNFFESPLTESENDLVQSADQFLQQLLESDRIVLAFPMYNFSVPATIKAWFDVVIQKDRTFRITDEGGYEGLLHDKKALILMTTGSDMSQQPAKSMDHAMPLAKGCLGFMGIESHGICAYGLNQYMDKVDDIVHQAQQETISFLNENEQW